MSSVINEDPLSTSATTMTTIAATVQKSPPSDRQQLLTSFLNTCTHSDLLFISRALPSLLNPAPTPSPSTPQSPLSSPSPAFLLSHQEQHQPDFFSSLPPELTLYVLELACNDDPWALVRAESVCRRWRVLVIGDAPLWQRACRVWGFGLPSIPRGTRTGSIEATSLPARLAHSNGYDQHITGILSQTTLSARQDEPLEEMEPYADLPMDPALEWIAERKRRAKCSFLTNGTANTHTDSEVSLATNATHGHDELFPMLSFRAHFRACCIKLIHWEKGGRLLRSHKLPMPFGSSLHHHQRHYLTPSLHPNSNSNPSNPHSREDDPTYLPSFNPNTNHHHQPLHLQQQQLQENGGGNSLVTSLALDPDWIVVGMGSSRIHVFSARTGVLARTLVGHESGVWGVCLVGAGGGNGVKRGEVNARRGIGDDVYDDGNGLDHVNTRHRKGKRRMERLEVEVDGAQTVGEPGGSIYASSSGPPSSSSSASYPSTSSSSASWPSTSLSPSYAEERGNSSDTSHSYSSGSNSRTRNSNGNARIRNGSEVDDGEGLYHSLRLPLRYAVGLGGGNDERDGGSNRRRSWGGKDKGKGKTRGVDEGLDDAMGDVNTVPSPSSSSSPSASRPLSSQTQSLQDRHIHRQDHNRHQRHQASGSGDLDDDLNERYTPQRQSDSCFASEGWGQPNALVVSGGTDKVVRVWDVRSGDCIYALTGHTSTIRCMRTLHGRPMAVTGSRDMTVRTWDIQRGKPLRVLRGHTGPVRCLDVNGCRAASGSYDTTCRIWDLDTGECLFVLRGHYHQVYAVSFDGELVATGGLDTSVRVWDANTGHCLALLQGHTSLVCELRLSRKHQILVTGGSDGRVITFSLVSYDPADPDFEESIALPPQRLKRGEIKNGRTANELDVRDVKGHLFVRKKRLTIPKPFFPKSNVNSLPGGTAMYPSFRTTAEGSSTAAPSGSPSQQYRQYRDDHRQARVAFEPLYSLIAHTSSITALQFDGRYLVTGGIDGSAHLWETQTGRYVRKLTEDGEKIWKVGFTSASSSWSRRVGLGDGDKQGEIESGSESESVDEGIGDVCVIVGQRGVKTVLEVWKFGE